LFKNNGKVENFNSVFSLCAEITGAVPAIWTPTYYNAPSAVSHNATHTKSFNGLTSANITNWTDIPSDWID
jgi:hypothetical protein